MSPLGTNLSKALQKANAKLVFMKFATEQSHFIRLHPSGKPCPCAKYNAWHAKHPWVPVP